MKVTDFSPQIKSTDKVEAKKVKGSALDKTGSPSSVKGSDRVELSASSAEVQKMRGILQETPSVRSDKVQALKEKIERGEYQINAYDVADKMLMSLLSDSGLE